MNDTTTGTTPVVPRKRRATDAMRARAALVQRLSVLWNSLSATQKAAWQAWHVQMGGKTGAQCFTTFLSANEALVNAGSQPLSTPGSAPYPPPLPEGLTLTATRTSAGAFSLKITGGTYASKVVLYASDPTLPLTDGYHPGAMKIIGSVPALTGSTEIGPQYVHAFGAAQASEKVAVKLVGISSSGLRTGEYLLSAVTTALVAEAGETGDSEQTSDDALQLHAA